jgi:hypothetical protein
MAIGWKPVALPSPDISYPNWFWAKSENFQPPMAAYILWCPPPQEENEAKSQNLSFFGRFLRHLSRE